MVLTLRRTEATMVFLAVFDEPSPQRASDQRAAVWKWYLVAIDKVIDGILFGRAPRINLIVLTSVRNDAQRTVELHKTINYTNEVSDIALLAHHHEHTTALRYALITAFSVLTEEQLSRVWEQSVSFKVHWDLDNPKYIVSCTIFVADFLNINDSD